MLLGTQRVRDDGVLEIGGASAVDLADRFGTPLYVIDEAAVRSRCREYSEALREAYPGPSAVAYAGKACLTMALCRVSDEEGLWLDVASGGELTCALEAGFPPSRLVMHGNNKSERELELLVRAKARFCVVDALEEVDALSAIVPRGMVQDALLRVTPGVECHTHEYMRVGRVDSKFGLSVGGGAALEGAERVLAAPGVALKGFHYHIGSQILSLEGFRDAANVMMEFCDSIRDRTGYEAEVLNLGGGLGVRHVDSDAPPSVRELARAVAEPIATACESRGAPPPTLMLEPGRSIVGEAGTTLYRVGVVKDIPGVRTYVAVDGGLSDNPRPALYGARYHVLFPAKMNDAPTQTVTISGKHCETDTLFPDVPAPHLSRGDLVAIPASGAYTFAMSSNYNRLSRPAMVHVLDGRADVVVERQTETDLLRWDRIPERLRAH